MPTRVSSFDEIEAEFQRRISRIVWCTMATIDPGNRPRSRILHPVWEGSTGWIFTNRHSPKERHIAHNPHVSLCYWDPAHEQIYAECKVAWMDDVAEKKRLWELFKSTPPPLGYDPILFWPGGSTDATFGVLKLSPWRIEMSSLAEMTTDTVKIWRSQS